eukprot:361399-Chlamydomonas_euryale.AAC.10
MQESTARRVEELEATVSGLNATIEEKDAEIARLQDPEIVQLRAVWGWDAGIVWLNKGGRGVLRCRVDVRVAGIGQRTGLRDGPPGGGGAAVAACMTSRKGRQQRQALSDKLKSDSTNQNWGEGGKGTLPVTRKTLHEQHGTG